MRRIILATLLLSVTCVLSAFESNLSTLDAVCPWQDNEGYTPVVVTFSARDSAIITFSASNASGEGTIAVEAISGVPSHRTLLLPPITSRWGSVQELTWRDSRGDSGTGHIARQHEHRSFFLALIDPKETVQITHLEESLGAAVTKGSGSGGSSGSSGSSGKSTVTVRVAPETLPDRWQGYPLWMTLILTPAGDAGLDDGQRRAIATWVRTGGALVVTSDSQRRIWAAAGADVHVVNLDGRQGLDWLSARLIHARDTSWSPAVVPVPGTEHVPVTAFVLLALAFAVVAGPINLWWVRRRKAHHLFLITTPALSLVTCVVLMVVSIFTDGLGIKRSAVQITFLDQARQQAVVWSGATFFAAFSQSAIELDPEAKTSLLTQVDDSYRRYRNAPEERLSIDWRTGQRLFGAVIPARLNRQLSFTQPRPDRRRLVVERAGDGWTATNGLGAKLTEVVWFDDHHQPWRCSSLDDGQTQPLTRRTEGATAFPNPLGGRISAAPEMVWAGTFHGDSPAPFGFHAIPARPLDPIPGPAAVDTSPAQCLVFGIAPPTGAGGAQP